MAGTGPLRAAPRHPGCSRHGKGRVVWALAALALALLAPPALAQAPGASIGTDAGCIAAGGHVVISGTIPIDRRLPGSQLVEVYPPGPGADRVAYMQLYASPFEIRFNTADLYRGDGEYEARITHDGRMHAAHFEIMEDPSACSAGPAPEPASEPAPTPASSPAERPQAPLPAGQGGMQDRVHADATGWILGTAVLAVIVIAMIAVALRRPSRRGPGTPGGPGARTGRTPARAGQAAAARGIARQKGPRPAARHTRPDGGVIAYVNSIFPREQYVPGPDDTILLDSNVVLSAVGYRGAPSDGLQRFVKEHGHRIRILRTVHREVRAILRNRGTEDMLKTYGELFGAPVLEDPPADREYAEVRRRQGFARRHEELALAWMHLKKRSLPRPAGGPDPAAVPVTEITGQDRNLALGHLFAASENDVRILAAAMSIPGAVLVTADGELILFARVHADDPVGDPADRARVAHPDYL